jgi:hypothetical protein
MNVFIAYTSARFAGISTSASGSTAATAAASTHSISL